MILNNATNSDAEWSISNEGDTIEGTKGAESWGIVDPPPGLFSFKVTFKGPNGEAEVDVNNPDACVTFTGNKALATYPGA